MLAVESDSKDTFIDMQDWTKRVVFVKSKHVVIGPQQKLYLPGLFSQADGRK
jgi:hypothetical protein